jgi:hypothetical protein
MKLSKVAHRINATKLYYLNLLGKLMLRPLFMNLGEDTGVASEPTPPPPTPDAPPPGCLIARSLGGMFDADFEACFLFFGGAGIDLARSLSLPLSYLLGPPFLLLPLLFVCLPLISC